MEESLDATRWFFKTPQLRLFSESSTGRQNMEKGNELALYNISDEHYVHLVTMMDAFYLYQEKDAIRGDMWRQFPPSDKIRELRERVMRINAAYSLDTGREAIISDAIDAINYNVFLIRQLREGAKG